MAGRPWVCQYRLRAPVHDGQPGLGDRGIDQGPTGISATTADGKNTGFVRDPAGTLIGMASGGNPYYYVTDNQGAPSALVDNSVAKQARWDYSPTGNARSGNTASAEQPFGYTGAYLDSSGLYKMGARYNDPTLGRFTQPDPSGQEQNLFLYAGGDPVNHVDPSGLFSLSDDFLDVSNNIWGAAVGCLAGIEAANASGIITAASIAGPWGTAGAVLGGCAVGGFLGYNNVDLISYG
ncbi:RHS repeat-associated core domain-containing protein [Streptomyces griseoluteus]|uniref:RHS repeat-associated core domain-containing protein n=1 Tax=Streptomyces griseoluteus TaxID=29306 RepID=UPI003804F5D8